jgi:signal transduction histidine kinase
VNRFSLRWKLIVSYLVVAAAGTLALIGTAELISGQFYEAHIREMTARYGSSAMDPMHEELRDGFARTLGRSLLVGLAVGIPLALAVAFWVARRVLGPVETVSQAARRIASGAYSERLPAGEADELGLLFEEFNRMAASLESTETKRVELIGTVAHELRTPLSGLQGYAEGLSDGLFTRDQAAQAIEREVARLKRLVNDLTEVSKVESGAVELRLETTDLSALARDVGERYEPMFREAGVFLCLDLPTERLCALADRDRVAQIVVNLLSNALRHAPGNPVELRVRRQNKEIRLEVKDFGLGIGKEHLPHLFERFYRADASRASASGGSGVGLTISSHLAQAMGGRLEVESAVGKGSSFALILPSA